MPEAGRTTLRVRAWQPVRALVRLRVEGGGRALLPGDVVSTEARLHRPRGYKNPGAFDVERALRGRGVEAVGAVMPPRGVRLVARGEPSLLARVAAWRASLGRHLDESLSGDRRALVGAMVLGERGLVTPLVEEAFRRAGITHLLSVSGLHLAALALLTYVALRRLLARVPRLALSVSVRALAATATSAGRYSCWRARTTRSCVDNRGRGAAGRRHRGTPAGRRVSAGAGRSPSSRSIPSRRPVVAARSPPASG